MGARPIATTPLRLASMAASAGLTVAVADLAALKALTSRPEVVTVETGQAKGQWQWEAGSSTTADDALVVTCTAGAAGRYKRIYDGIIYATWFNAKFDDSTDDTAALTAFFNAAIALKPTFAVMPYGVAQVTAALPTIDTSGVALIGSGPGGLHDVGSQPGTVIKYVGVAGPTMLTIAPDEGAGNQRLIGIKFLGITLDCNSLAAKGLLLKSTAYSDFDFSVMNPTSIGFETSVCTTLGETADVQYNNIRYSGRCVEHASGIGMVLGGDANANTSLNTFVSVVIQHKDGLGIREDNADNNVWGLVHVFRAAGGTATNSVEWRGGASAGVACRSELFQKFTATVAPIAKGTGTYTVGATKIHILSLDKENSTPDPTVETGASVYWTNDSTPVFPSDWTAWTPTVTASSGTITTVGTVTARYQRVGKTVNFRVTIAITTNGTGAGFVKFTLPTGINTIANGAGSGSGRASIVSGSQLQVLLPNGDTAGYIADYAGVYPAVDGETLIVSGFYEVA